MEWLYNNYEWIFSGVGVFALSLFLIRNKRKTKENNQTIKAGNNSMNIQINKKD